MRYDFVYENNNGEKINLSKLPYKINIEPLIDYSWSYKTKQRQLGNKIVGFFKDIKDSTATLHVLAATATERDEAIDYFNNVIEKDIYYGTAGKLWLGDWYTYAFITASKNSKWQYDAGIVKKEITISKEADSWYHITRSANYGEQEESTVYIAEDYIKTYEGRDAESDIKSLVANIVPKQSGSGTPSPDNIRPISGWESVETSVCGKNIFDESVLLQATDWAVNDGVYSGYSRYIHAPFNNGVPNLKFNTNTQYTISFTYNQEGTGTGFALTVHYTDGAVRPNYYKENNAGKNTIVTEQGKTVNKISLSYGENRIIYLSEFQLELGTTATAYEPYTATTHTTSLGRTVYGGTVDVVSGVLTVDRAMITLDGSDQTFSEVSQGSTADGTLYVAYIPKNTLGSKEDGVALADSYEWQDKPLSALHIGQFDTRGSYLRFVIADQSLDTLAKWEAYLAQNPLQLCYELATPQTYTLTPQQINTLAGVNNVWVDSGNVTVTFRDDHGDIQTESGSIVTFEKKNALSGSGYDYAYDYMHDAQSQKIIANAGSIPCDFIITIQGYADSPIITIGDNTYAVNVEVPYGANLVIDSTQKTVIITLADGTKINAFGARDPDYYLFERIESGKNAVTWDGSYLWELLMIEERSEPRWLTD